MSVFVQQPHRRVRSLGNMHVYSELANIEQNALAHDPRIRGMRGLGDATPGAVIAARAVTVALGALVGIGVAHVADMVLGPPRRVISKKDFMTQGEVALYGGAIGAVAGGFAATRVS
jgi:hypothetical protein